MRCWFATVVGTSLLGFAVGCSSGTGTGDSGKSPASNPDSTTPANAVANAPTDRGGPAEAVSKFLEAVRSGNDEVATKMFTPLARQKASEMGIQVAPRGSDTASFEVGQVEMVGQDGARVTSKWTDLDKSGQRRTDEIIWILRRETEGWRVAGMAATVFDGEPPLVLNFEQPEETMRRLDALREQIQRRTASTASPNQQPQPDRQPQDATNLQQPAQTLSATVSAPAQPAHTAPGQPATGDVREARRSANPGDPFQQ